MVVSVRIVPHVLLVVESVRKADVGASVPKENISPFMVNVKVRLLAQLHHNCNNFYLDTNRKDITLCDLSLYMYIMSKGKFLESAKLII